MKKRVLVALMAVFMVIGMAGCGNTSAGSYSSELSRSSEAASYPNEAEETKSSYVAESSSEAAEESTPSASDERVGVRPTDTESGLGGESEASAEVPTETPSTDAVAAKDLPGIVMCVQNYIGPGTGWEYVLFVLDPEAGTCTEIATFHPYDIGDDYYNLNIGSYHQNLTDTFSRDFSKMAVTYVKAYTTERYAGWIDTEGNFFDVPKAAGLGPENEFVAQPGYYAVGFTDDGNYFVFAEVVGEHPNTVKDDSIYNFGKFYYVALDDPTTAYEGNPLAENTVFGGKMTKMTAMINDTEYLVNYGDNSVIKRTDDRMHAEEYISGEARINYDGVVGPDGTFAFLSAVKKTYADTAVYVTARDGSGLRRVFDYETFTASGEKFAYSRQTWIDLLYWK